MVHDLAGMASADAVSTDSPVPPVAADSPELVLRRALSGEVTSLHEAALSRLPGTWEVLTKVATSAFNDQIRAEAISALADLGDPRTIEFEAAEELGEGVFELPVAEEHLWFRNLSEFLGPPCRRHIVRQRLFDQLQLIPDICHWLNSRFSQILEKSQSRSMVRGEIFMTSLISSTLNPPK